MIAQQVKIESEWEIKHAILIEDYKHSQNKMAFIRGQIMDLTEQREKAPLSDQKFLVDRIQKQIEEYEYNLFCEKANYLRVRLILEWVEVKMGYPEGMALEECKEIL